MKKWLNALLLILLGMAASAVIFLIASPPRSKSVELVPAPTPAPMLVQVDGAVEKPGVYTIPRDSRVQNAIQAAGGLRVDANQSAVNLAARVRDGEKLVIPALGTPVVPVSATESTSTKSQTTEKPQATSGQPVNINTATLEELETLPGIGATRAQQIIDYREAQGGFKTIEEIQNISGIGPATFAKLKDLITLD